MSAPSTFLGRDQLRWLLSACSNDDTRQCLWGVHVDADGWTSTDGHRLHHQTHAVDAARPDAPVTLDKAQLTSALSKRGAFVHVAFNADHATVKVGKHESAVRYLEHKFAPYSRVVPRSYKTLITVDAESLRELFRLWSYDRPPVVVWGDRSQIKLWRDIGTREGVYGKLELACPLMNRKGEPVTTGIEDRYAFEALAIAYGTVDVELGGELDPLTFRMRGGAYAVVMPMRI